jgi:ubiquinone/menaquinone biosynthesis C-methylase UbiE
MHEQALRGIIPLLQRASLFPLSGRRIADIGCGDGTWLLEFAQWGADPADMCGIDLSKERIHRARRRLPQADLRTGGAASLPWPDQSFHLVSQFTVFTSILDPALKRAVAAEMLRVLKPNGVILWFDFRLDNPANPQVRGVRASEVRSLFAGCDVELTSILLAPPLARLIARWSWPLAQLLHTLPLLRTHYAGLIRRNDPHE